MICMELQREKFQAGFAGNYKGRSFRLDLQGITKGKVSGWICRELQREKASLLIVICIELQREMFQTSCA